MKVAALYRHPIKAHGVEALDTVMAEAGACLPFDRHWAVAHEASSFDESAPQWVSCANFTRGAKAHGLMAITCSLDEGTGMLTLTHPDLGSISIHPDSAEGSEALVEWTAGFVPTSRAQSTRIVRAPGRGMTDSDFPSVSLYTTAALDDLSQKAGRPMARERFRGNIWIEGAEAWAEMTWVGQKLRIGAAVMEVVEPITRCRATTVNPETGASDFETLRLLETEFGHQEFGVNARVIQSGAITSGDTVELL